MAPARSSRNVIVALSLAGMQRLVKRVRPYLLHIQQAAGAVLMIVGLLKVLTICTLVSSYVNWWS